MCGSRRNGRHKFLGTDGPRLTEMKTIQLQRERQRKWWKGKTWWQWAYAILVVILVVGGATAVVFGPVWATSV